MSSKQKRLTMYAVVCTRYSRRQTPDQFKELQDAVSQQDVWRLL